MAAVPAALPSASRAGAPGGQEAPVLLRVFPGLQREHAFVPLRVEGRMPPDLHGTLYRNGPSTFTAGTKPHWFDGTGAVTAVRLEAGRASGAVRVTHAPSADHDAGRRRNRYAGFRQPMSWVQRLRALFGQPAARNMASINVLPWQSRLFALMETTLPLELDPGTLESLGETTLNGVIPGAWNAHPKYVPARRTTYQFGVRMGPQVHLDVFALPDAGQARRLASIPLPGMMEVHDFFATEHHLVFLLPPLWCDPLRVLWEGSGFGGLEWHPEAPTRILVMPIDRPSEPLQLETEPFFFYHAVNASEQAGRISVQLMRYRDYATVAGWLAAVPEGRDGPAMQSRLWDAVIDLGRRRVAWEKAGDFAGELPAVHPDVRGRRHNRVWLAGWSASLDGRGWSNELIRHDRVSGDILRLTAGDRCIVGEPTVVPRSPDEDDAWVLCLVRDLAGDSSYLGVWDAASPQAGCVAKAFFDQALPPALHGCWVPSVPSE